MTNFLIYHLESGICLALLYMVYWIFLRRETFFTFNRLYLISAVPISFILPLIHFPSPFITSPPAGSSFTSTLPVGTGVRSLAFSDVLWLIFLLGACFFLLRFLFRLLCLFLLVKKYGCQQQAEVKIVCIDKKCAPFSFFNFLFLNRSNLSDPDYYRIIAHECVHIKQYHSLDLILTELLTILQWFNPFVRPYKKSLKETHEYLADNAVIAQGCSKAKYQVLIFEQQVGMKLFEFANNFNHSQIKRRITMMERIKSRGRAKLKGLLILPAIALLLLAFAEPKTAQEQEKEKWKDAETVMIAPDTPHDSTYTTDKDKSDEKKKKEMKMKQKELTMKEKQLKEELEKTKDPEKRELIKKKLMEIQKMKEGAIEVKVMTDEDFEKKMIELKKAYENTDDPEKKAAIKEKALQLKKMQEEAKKVKGAKEANPVAVGSPEWNKKKKELKVLISKTDDPEKKAELMKKLDKMKKMEEQEKKKAAEKKKD